MRLLIALICLLPAFALAQEYDRSEWRHWLDFDYDCQNSRQEVLIAHSVDQVTLDSDGCRVATGLWILPYTQTLTADISAIHIDHVIPLKYAHDAGGAAWSPLLKKLFANDPDNLLPVQGVANMVKGSKGPAEFMPAEAYRCEYARKWRMLARKYELNLKAEDLDATSAALADYCEEK